MTKKMIGIESNWHFRLERHKCSMLNMTAKNENIHFQPKINYFQIKKNIPSLIKTPSVA